MWFPSRVKVQKQREQFGTETVLPNPQEPHLFGLRWGSRLSWNKPFSTRTRLCTIVGGDEEVRFMKQGWKMTEESLEAP